MKQRRSVSTRTNRHSFFIIISSYTLLCISLSTAKINVISAKSGGVCPGGLHYMGKFFCSCNCIFHQRENSLPLFFVLLVEQIDGENGDAACVLCKLEGNFHLFFSRLATEYKLSSPFHSRIHIHTYTHRK